MVELLWLVLFAFVPVTPASERTPVLVELFTSEGCSSCPPADQLLIHLLERQPVPGVEIIALSEHVDYWNRLGWRDPFSSAQFTKRQSEYADTFGGQGSYTPQMVVDGITDFVGSDSKRAVDEIAKAAKKTSEPLLLTAQDLKLHVEIPALEAADVYLAVVENNLSSSVLRGENEGRKISHVAVVRKLNVLGKTKAGTSFTADPVIAVARDWKRADLRAVVFAQSIKTPRRILSVASVPLSH